ncbi:anti-sigma factor [Microbacterium aurugineum]|uniref:anti-sigma factor n=1 Tax=Microbacterium aurugineum TaxID=2851642 RepID=UPI0020BEC235|nr:anti-sigma factor [Microbacterium aurugineum]MCK8478684.1 anti-sigma factor [Microbacterium aurugineum]
MNEKDFAELAAGAALHSLSADDERRYLTALAEHPEWEDTVDEDAATAASLADPVEPVTAPAHIRSALLAQIVDLPQDGGTRSDPDATSAITDVPAATQSDAIDTRAEQKPKQRRWTRSVFALAACLAVLVGVGIGAVALNQQLNPPASVVALQEIEAAGDAEQATVALDDGGSATAHWSASVGKAVLVADGIPTPAEGETYELWFVRGDAPVSAGVFDVDGGDATALLTGEMQAGDAIAVTVEQAGGSPTGQPTTDPVIVIPTA